MSSPGPLRGVEPVRSAGPTGVFTRPRATLDRLLGRMTMYRLVLSVLVALGVVALIESIAGIVSFTPQAIVVSAALALAVSWGSNRLFALVWRVRPHGESSLVTGMLVFCLFWPVLDARNLGAIALAAAAANLSKYLLAWHGRHVFNPIALGAVVVSVTAISGATWWVATPALLPVIVLGGALVLYRTGTWDIALLVVAITVLGTTAKSVALGTAAVPALWTAVASYPYLFFAAFMVTEPLTLPPRRWQRLLEGAVIGGLAIVPLQIGYLAMAPEIALLVGNAVAFPFGPRRRVRLTLQRSETLDGGIADLWLRPESPLRIRPGQYVELSLPHRGQDARGARRVISVANRPDGELVRVATRVASPSSSFKRRLLALEPGAVIGGSGVGGDFVLPADAGVPMLWIAGGIGITPFASFADDLAQRGDRRDVVLVHEVRTVADLAFGDAFERAGIRTIVIGPPQLADDLSSGARYGGGSLDDLDADAITAGRVAYVAGSPALVATATATARRLGARRIRRDRFIGY